MPLLGVTLLACFLADRTPKQLPPPVTAPVSEVPAAISTASADDAAVAAPESMPSGLNSSALAESDEPVAEAVVDAAVTEGSWAREMRELRELTARDPEAALTWVAQQPTREEREDALRIVCPLLAQWNPAGAMNAAWSFQLGKDSEGQAASATLEALARRWAEADLPAALAWADERPAEENDDRRDWILKGLASTWSQTAPADAALLVAEQISHGPVQVQAAMVVLDQWAASDLAGATAWAECFPEGDLNDMAFKKLARWSVPRDPEAQ